jgi:NHL repeat
MLKHDLIPEPCVLQVHPSTGKVLQSWGARQFAMPHGLSLDWQGHVWITDAGLHQVFKFSKQGELLWKHGTAWQPGDDLQHFCKPTDVAALPNGDVWVSDGYCNHRALSVVFSGGTVPQIARNQGWTCWTSLHGTPVRRVLGIAHPIAYAVGMSRQEVRAGGDFVMKVSDR